MDKQTVLAIVRIVTPAICSICALFGYAVDADAWTNAALLIVGTVVSVPCAWFDNDVTKRAKHRKALGEAAVLNEVQ